MQARRLHYEKNHLNRIRGIWLATLFALLSVAFTVRAQQVHALFDIGRGSSVQFQHNLANMPFFPKDVLSGSDVTERIGLGP